MRRYLHFIIFMFCLFSLIGCGLGSVQNLHFSDRIPHETQKGFVVFSSTSEAEPEMVNAMTLLQEQKIIGYQIYLKEFNHKIPITAVGGISSPKTSPVTITPGNHTLIIEYTFALGFSGMDDQVQKQVFGEKALLMLKDFSGNSFAFYKKIKPMEIQLTIKKDQTTHVRFHSFFKIHNNGNAEKGPFLIEVNATSDEPELTALTGFEILKGAKGPGVYAGKYDEVYKKTCEAIETLGWEITKADADKGVIHVIIKRFPANPFVFTIGVNDLADGKIQVNVSSDSFWQRWGTINTGMSLEKINELYGKIDALM
jgi:hypothetical protein